MLINHFASAFNFNYRTYKLSIINYQLIQLIVLILAKNQDK